MGAHGKSALKCGTSEATTKHKLPQRYQEPWRQTFHDRFLAVAIPGTTILDAGSGRSPAIPVPLRPDGCRYVGLDISADELARAPAGSYDDIVVADLLGPPRSLLGQFDLVVSWQLLEHVRSLQRALDSIHDTLRPDGNFVGLLSGRWAIFAVANRLLPRRVGVDFLQSRLGRDPETVFRAYYDQATFKGIRRCLSHWAESEVVPRFRGGVYLSPSPRLQQLYLAYEGWAAAGHPNLATHYLVSARK